MSEIITFQKRNNLLPKNCNTLFSLNTKPSTAPSLPFHEFLFPKKFTWSTRSRKPASIFLPVHAVQLMHSHYITDTQKLETKDQTPRRSFLLIKRPVKMTSFSFTMSQYNDCMKLAKTKTVCCKISVQRRPMLRLISFFFH